MDLLGRGIEYCDERFYTKMSCRKDTFNAWDGIYVNVISDKHTSLRTVANQKHDMIGSGGGSGWTHSQSYSVIWVVGTGGHVPNHKAWLGVVSGGSGWADPKAGKDCFLPGKLKQVKFPIILYVFFVQRGIISLQMPNFPQISLPYYLFSPPNNMNLISIHRWYNVDTDNNYIELHLT